MINILHITVNDLQGSRFNGYSMIKHSDEEFNFEMADIIIVFAKDKKSFTITQGGKDIKFTKE